MAGPPEDVKAALARGIAAFLKATPPQELPARFRPIRGFAPKAMAQQRRLLLGALDDDSVRPRMKTWLEEGKHPLPKADAALLEVAVSSEGPWVDAFGPTTEEEEREEGPSPARVQALEKAVEREKEKTRKAREELRRRKEEMETALRAERTRAGELEHRLERSAEDLTAARGEAAAARDVASKAEEETARRERRWKKDSDAFKVAVGKGKQEARDLRRELRAVRAELERLQQDVARKPPEDGGSEAPEAAEAREPRRPLPFTPGLVADDPKTLDAWLDADAVWVLVDGYNVTMAESGFGEMTLADGRRRLMDEINKLARKKKVETTVVFDGADVPPGVPKLSRGPARVQYSAPDETADDRLISLLEGWPPSPVVVVTNDRELQGRAAALGATVATSDQLLRLLRA